MFNMFKFSEGSWHAGFIALSPLQFYGELALPSPPEKKRASELLGLIKSKLPAKSDLRAWQSDLELVARSIPEPMMQDFSAYLLLHASKNEDRIQERKRTFYERFEALIDEPLNDDQQRLAQFYLKLIPDVDVAPAAQALAGTLRALSHSESDIAGFDDFRERCAESGVGVDWLRSVCSAPEHEVERRIERMAWALEQPGVEALLTDLQGWIQREIPVRLLWMDELHAVLSKCHASGSTTQLGRQLRAFKITCREKDEAANRATFLATAKALEQGVDFGRFTVLIRGVLEVKGGLWQRLQNRWEKAEVQRSKASELPAPKDTLSDPAYSWPIEKLVEWINGPVSAPDKKPTMQTPKAAPPKGQPASGRGRNPGRGREPQSGRGEVPTATKASAPRTPFGPVHIEGIRRYAAYMLADLRDMAQLCAPYKLDSALRGQLETSLRVIENTAKRADPERDISRQRFAEADALIAKLRGVVKAQKAEEDYMRAFKIALDSCIAEAPLAYGRHFGGEIECPSRHDAWPAIYEAYHNVWLPDVKEILFDNQPAKLGDDQALAYYVTGSSNSGYAFCISVHLWRRRAESTAPPVAALSPDLPDSAIGRMDTEHWMDTRIPCSVFHVPGPN